MYCFFSCRDGTLYSHYLVMVEREMYLFDYTGTLKHFEFTKLALDAISYRAVKINNYIHIK